MKSILVGIAFSTLFSIYIVLLFIMSDVEEIKEAIVVEQSSN